MDRATVVKNLRQLFLRNGHVRRVNPRRVEEDGWRHYHKGDELRLTANTVLELRFVRRLLRDAGLTPGRPFVKGRQYRQPVYGRDAVARFLELITE